MKKTNQCNECRQTLPDDYLCDTCGKNLTQKRNDYVQELGKPTMALDSSIILYFNGTDYDFCDWRCLLQFVLQELKKQEPKENRFIYGKEN